MKKLSYAALTAFSLAVLVAPVKAAETAKPAPATAAATVVPKTGVAATVNGEKIMNADVERLMAPTLARFPELNSNTPEAKKNLAEARDLVINQMIDRALLAQEIQRLKLEPPKATYDKAMEDFRKGFKDDAELKKWVQESGRTEADFAKLIREQLAIEELQTRWIADVTVSDAEIQKFYTDNPDDFKMPERRSAHHVLIMVKPDAKPEESAKALKTANEVLKKAKAQNADFGKLATEYSEDPSAKENKGDLGEFARGQMVPEFEDAVFKAKVGDVLGPIKTQFGYHVVRVDGTYPAALMPLDDRLKPMVREYLLQRKQSEFLSEKLAALRASAKIEKM